VGQFCAAVCPLGGSILEYQTYVVEKAIRYAPLIKDKSFEEEKEWRLIISGIGASNEAYCFLNNNIVLKPYFKVSLPNKNIFRIARIGPTDKFELVRDSIPQFFSNENKILEDIVKSSIPFRVW